MVLIILDKQNYTLRTLKKNEKAVISFQTDIINETISNISGDLLFISNNQSLIKYLETGNRSDAEHFTTDLVALSKIRANYDQLRYIDEQGRERIRVNYQFGEPYVVTENNLQFKGDRYYFKNTMAKTGNTIYISPLDLNIEKGIIELPFKPMIRFSVKLYSNGRERGIFIINYSAKEMLNRLKSTATTALGDINMVNGSGFWLASAKEGDEWGFMLDERSSRTFKRDFPVEWDNITYGKSGQIQTNNGIFTYNTISLIDTSKITEKMLEAENNVEIWRLIQYVPEKNINKLRNALNDVVISAIVIAFFLSFIPAWIAAELYGKKQMAKTTQFLVKNYDPITKMPGRNLFINTISDKINFASKNHDSLGLLLFEIANLTELIQKCGTDATEHVLLSSAELFKSEDKKLTSFSLGGGKFALIAYNIEDRRALEKLKKDYLRELNSIKPDNIATFNVLFAAGSCFYPEDAYEQFAVLKFAEDSLQNALNNIKS
jgi:GGDEF domain-containing protein